MVITSLQPSLHTMAEFLDLAIDEANSLEGVDVSALRREFDELSSDDDSAPEIEDEILRDLEEIIQGAGFYLYTWPDCWVVSTLPLEPQDDDWIISDRRRGGYALHVPFGPEVAKHDSVDVLARYAGFMMRREQFWPNLWTVSDHGNYTLIDTRGREITS
tara:strand:- start:44 stop:523 length:480 start_codon:yes stop_codon:yes gene_type:complete